MTLHLLPSPVSVSKKEYTSISQLQVSRLCRGRNNEFETNKLQIHRKSNAFLHLKERTINCMSSNIIKISRLIKASFFSLSFFSFLFSPLSNDGSLYAFIQKGGKGTLMEAKMSHHINQKFSKRYEICKPT